MLGILSFGDFSLDKQRKVTRLEGAKTEAEDQHNSKKELIHTKAQRNRSDTNRGLIRESVP